MQNWVVFELIWFPRFHKLIVIAHRSAIFMIAWLLVTSQGQFFWILFQPFCVISNMFFHNVQGVSLPDSLKDIRWNQVLVVSLHSHSFGIHCSYPILRLWLRNCRWVSTLNSYFLNIFVIYVVAYKRIICLNSGNENNSNRYSCLQIYYFSMHYHKKSLLFWI